MNASKGDTGSMSTTEAEIQAAICTMISEELDWSGDPDTLTGSDPVQLVSILDSAALLELASAVEVTYDIEIDDVEITPDTFATVESLAHLVSEKVA
jgi:acyl carrier protein